MPSSQTSHWLGREPAYCAGRRFAIPLFYTGCVTVTDASPRRVQSLRGHTAVASGRGLPTALPAVCGLALYEAAGEGFAVMSGIDTRDHSRAGQPFTRQGISLELVPMSPWGSDHIFDSVIGTEPAGVWPLRIPLDACTSNDDPRRVPVRC